MTRLSGFFRLPLLIGLACSAALTVQTQTRAEGRLPDGSTASWSGSGDISAAWYGSPTTRYRHAILGDGIEAGSLHVHDKAGRQHVITLPRSQVFEDRTPRLSDLDGDGRVEVVTIRSFQTEGGSVAIYGLRDGRLRELASSKPIGRANRWLNIAGIADYAGLGRKQIAFVETPHIGGTLCLAEWQGNQLAPIGRFSGFSNHRIGAREQNLTITGDFNGDGQPDLAVPANERDKVRFVTFTAGKLVEIGRAKLPSDVKSAADDQRNAACARFILENGDIAEACLSNQ